MATRMRRRSQENGDVAAANAALMDIDDLLNQQLQFETLSSLSKACNLNPIKCASRSPPVGL